MNLPKRALDIITDSPCLLSMLYDLGMLPEQLRMQDVPRVVYLAYWYEANADKLVRDARGL